MDLLTEGRAWKADPAPGPCCRWALALAALAVQVHGWELRVRSGYLPHSLLGSTDALRQAADSDTNVLGLWTAR